MVVKIILISVLSLAALYLWYIIVRLVWLVSSIRKLHAAVQSIATNQLALLYLQGDMTAIQNYNNPYAESFEVFIDYCGGRIKKLFYNPFASWNMYALLPNVQTALWLKRNIDSGVATTSQKEYSKRAQELLAQIHADTMEEEYKHYYNLFPNNEEEED
jgi:hypothetical protein